MCVCADFRPGGCMLPPGTKLIRETIKTNVELEVKEKWQALH